MLGVQDVGLKVLGLKGEFMYGFRIYRVHRVSDGDIGSGARPKQSRPKPPAHTPSTKTPSSLNTIKPSYRPLRLFLALPFTVPSSLFLYLRVLS